MPTPIEAVRWSPDGAAVRIIDQTALPAALHERDLRTLDDVCEAIATLRVRGAPAIGIAASMGLVASLRAFAQEPADRFRARLADHAARLADTRPTAVNLRWALDRLTTAAANAAELDPAALLHLMRNEATRILEEDRAMCRRIGEHALPLLPDGARVLTHCNAGALATGGIGTALAPLYLAAEQGRRVEVYVNETRPLLQGSRLTAWELSRAGIPVTVLTDGMAASVMARGEVDLCIVGADRVARNGDVANKIGTYSVAIAARHHGVPFHVAAPTSTLDRSIPSGDAIPIEHRASHEVLRAAGLDLPPDGVRVHNPAFDVTPASLITSIVTDVGLFAPPYDLSAVARTDGGR